MLDLAVTLQIIATLVCFLAVLVVANKKPSSYSNVIIIAFLCTSMQNGGYILELLSKSASEAMIAVKAEYLGAAFEICLITFFIFKYCGHEFNRMIKTIILVESCIVLVCVWTWEINPLYYTGVEFVTDAAIPHLVLHHGWFYYAFAITTIVELIACVFILTVSILKTNQEHMKTNYVILLGVAGVPLCGFVIGITGICGGYDSTPMSAAVAVGIFAFAIARKHVFDVADAAGEMILSNLDNAIIIINNDKGYEYSNKLADGLFPVLKSYSRGEVIKDISVERLFDERSTSEVVIGEKTFEVNINKVRIDDEVIGTTAILFDVTDARAQIEKMKELKEDAEDANRAKSVFLANISHEIRTPINTIMGMSELLLRDYAVDETRGYLYNIRNSSNTLLNLISDIIDFSKIESGKLELENAKFDATKLLTELVNIFQFRCEQKNLKFAFDISGDLPRYLIGDESRVRQIATNLLSNAVKYTNEGTVKLRIEYKFRSDYDLDLMMAVEDTGVGIKHEDYEKIFTSFGRDKIQRRPSVEGTGLGLNITKQLTEMLGGIINFKSEVGKGSVFSVVIPLLYATDSSETVGEISLDISEEEVYRATFTTEEAEILIVDDSPINLQVNKELLRDINPKITLVTSGEECLEMVREKHYDLIFMDHRMSGMDGVETFSRIKQSDNECKDTPVIMITANATYDARDWYLAKGFTDFLPMPVGTRELATMLYKYLPERLINVKTNE